MGSSGAVGVANAILIHRRKSVQSHIESLVSQCFNLKDLLQTHGFMVPRGLDADNLLLAQFIRRCSSLGFSTYAISRPSPSPSVTLYNSLAIRALSLSPKQALSVFRSIQPAGLRPDSYSFPPALKAVAKLSAFPTGTQLHCQVTRFGFGSHVSVVTALLQMYSACGHFRDARKLFDGFLDSSSSSTATTTTSSSSSRDVALWNAMLSSYVRLGDLRSARDLFETMPERNIISWTALIAGYAQANLDLQAIALFRRMQLQGEEEEVEPDHVAILALLSACAHLGALELGESIHAYILKHPSSQWHSFLPLHNALIDMYAKSGNIPRALRVFENVKCKSVVTWTTMIAGLALHGLGSEALEMFSRMEMAGVTPNAVTFVALLSACTHVGLVHIGRHYFRIMTSKYRIQPKIAHYGCMLDLLGRAGYLQEAQQLLARMPFEPNAAIWGSLLAASNTHADARLGNLALRHLIKLEPNNSGNYLLLSNIYSSLGRWDDSRMVRKLMRDTGVKKMPGSSSIQVNNRIHEFISEETSHPEFNRIHEALCQLNSQSALRAGYLEMECAKFLELDEE